MANTEIISQQVEKFFIKEQWEKARNVITKALKQEPDDHWLVTRLATTYYEERNYEKSLELNLRALKLNPRCPLVLWDYAGTLDMLKDYKRAISIWKKLISRDVEKLAYGECGEGLRWARSLINDCRYRIGLAYKRLGKTNVAKRYLNSHIENRSPGIPSIYPLQKVKKILAELQQSNLVVEKRQSSNSKKRYINKGKKK